MSNCHIPVDNYHELGCAAKDYTTQNHTFCYRVVSVIDFRVIGMQVRYPATNFYLHGDIFEILVYNLVLICYCGTGSINKINSQIGGGVIAQR